MYTQRVAHQQTGTINNYYSGSDHYAKYIDEKTMQLIGMDYKLGR